MDRVVLVSADTDARSAALAQADIQAALGSRRVLMARAVLLDVGKVADVIRDATGSPHVTGELVSLMPQTQEEQQELLRPYIEQLTPLFNQWIRNAQGLRGFNLAYALEQGINQLRKLRLVTEADDDGPARLDLVEPSGSDAAHAAIARGWGSCWVIFLITALSLARVNVHSNGWAMVR